MTSIWSGNRPTVNDVNNLFSSGNITQTANHFANGRTYTLGQGLIQIPPTAGSLTLAEQTEWQGATGQGWTENGKTYNGIMTTAPTIGGILQAVIRHCLANHVQMNFAFSKSAYWGVSASPVGTTSCNVMVYGPYYPPDPPS